jgi:type II secretory ATPase GspE/PulE/Tfp pilus assembly ATPase PilB-like protein
VACKKGYEPERAVVEDMKNVLGKLWAFDFTNGKLPQIFRGEGCNQCGGTGYKGRVGVFEVLPITEKIGRLILEHAPASEIERDAIEEGMVTMKQDGYLKVVEGLTSIEEVLRVAQE